MKLFSIVLILTAALSAQDGARGWQKFSGSWKQVPGPDNPKNIRIEREGSTKKFSFNCKEHGSCLIVIVGDYDGKPYKDEGNPAWTATFKKTGDRTMQNNIYIQGKLVRTVNFQLSADGNTLTGTEHEISPPAPKDFRYVYDRSGGPVSQDDPFVGFWKRNWGKSDVLITTFSSKGGAMTVTASGQTFERDCDGKDHPNPGDTTVLYSCRMTDPSTYDLVQKKNEKVVSSLTRKISGDGKKMVAIWKNAEGNTASEATYEKIE